jgi:hypothetical protein
MENTSAAMIARVMMLEIDIGISLSVALSGQSAGGGWVIAARPTLLRPALLDNAWDAGFCMPWFGIA